MRCDIGDVAARIERLTPTEVAKILNDEVPWIYLWSPNSSYAASKRLQGFSPPSYSNNKFWNAETWSVTS